MRISLNLFVYVFYADEDVIKSFLIIDIQLWHSDIEQQYKNT